MRDIVERLKGNAVRQRRVAEDADDVFIRAFFVARRRHAERGGQGRAGVTGAKTIVRAFRAQRKTVQAVRLADGAKTIFAPGQNFVDVNLMAHVPDKFVARRCEDAMEGDGQFDHAEVRAEMAARLRQAVNQFLPDFPGKLFELHRREFFDVLRPVNHVEVSAHNFVKC